MNPTRTFRGGSSIGKNILFSMHADWPFSKMEIYQDYLLIDTVLAAKVRLPKDEIDTILPYRQLFFTGIEIKHHNPDVKPFVVFFPTNPSGLQAVLQEAGYPLTI